MFALFRDPGVNRPTSGATHLCSKLFSKIAAVICLAIAAVAISPHQASADTVSFTAPGTSNFTVPPGVTSIKVVVVGGGGGGANGHQGGGGSGFVNSGTLTVSPSQILTVTVGAGGSGAQTQNGNNIVGLTAGGSSSFGSISAQGGRVVTGINQTGNNGGSGGGGACNLGPIGGAGGTNGSNGGACTYLGGTGQGSFSTHFSLISEATLSAGNGGAGGISSHAGGGGGGGVLVNGSGPSGQNGIESYSAKGGSGYGAGGGAGDLTVQIVLQVAMEQVD